MKRFGNHSKCLVPARHWYALVAEKEPGNLAQVRASAPVGSAVASEHSQRELYCKEERSILVDWLLQHLNQIKLQVFIPEQAMIARQLA